MRTPWIVLLLTAPALGQTTQPAAPTCVVTDGKGQTRYTLKPRSDGFNVVDPTGKRRFRIKLDARRAKVRDPLTGKTLAYVNTDGRKWKVKDAKTKQTRFKLQPRASGGYKVETGADVTVAKLKPDGKGGFKVEAGGKTVGKVVRRKGGWRVRDAAGRELGRGSATMRPLAVACLLLPKLTEAERIGLLALVARTPKPKPKPKPPLDEPKPGSRPTSKPAR